MDYPTVSVIVLNYNGLRYMENCFASLSRLNYPADRVELVCQFVKCKMCVSIN